MRPKILKKFHSGFYDVLYSRFHISSLSEKHVSYLQLAETFHDIWLTVWNCVWLVKLPIYDRLSNCLESPLVCIMPQTFVHVKSPKNPYMKKRMKWVHYYPKYLYSIKIVVKIKSIKIQTIINWLRLNCGSFNCNLKT